MTKPAAFRQADLIRALKCAEQAGLQVARFEINDNGISVIVGEPEKLKRNRADQLYGT